MKCVSPRRRPPRSRAASPAPSALVGICRASCHCGVPAAIARRGPQSDEDIFSQSGAAVGWRVVSRPAPEFGRTMNYEEREQHKRNGWKLYHRSDSVAEKARGLFMIIEAHFHRSTKAPSLAAYASHWLWANQGGYEHEVIDFLIARYPLPEHPRIRPGSSYWDS